MKQLTTEQMFSLFEIATGCFNRSSKYIEQFGVNWIQIEDSGHRLHHFKIIENEVDVRYGRVFDFRYYTSDLRGDFAKEESVRNQKLLHERLTEFGFYS